MAEYSKETTETTVERKSSREDEPLTVADRSMVEDARKDVHTPDHFSDEEIKNAAEKIGELKKTIENGPFKDINEVKKFCEELVKYKGSLNVILEGIENDLINTALGKAILDFKTVRDFCEAMEALPEGLQDKFIDSTSWGRSFLSIAANETLLKFWEENIFSNESETACTAISGITTWLNNNEEIVFEVANSAEFMKRFADKIIQDLDKSNDKAATIKLIGNALNDLPDMILTELSENSKLMRALIQPMNDLYRSNRSDFIITLAHIPKQFQPAGKWEETLERLSNDENFMELLANDFYEYFTKNRLKTYTICNLPESFQKNLQEPFCCTGKDFGEFSLGSLSMLPVGFQRELITKDKQKQVRTILGCIKRLDITIRLDICSDKKILSDVVGKLWDYRDIDHGRRIFNFLTDGFTVAEKEKVKGAFGDLLKDNPSDEEEAPMRGSGAVRKK